MTLINNTRETWASSRKIKSIILFVSANCVTLLPNFPINNTIEGSHYLNYYIC